MAVSIERAGWGSTARSPGEECLQVASVSRSAVHQKAQADFSPAWAGTQLGCFQFSLLVWKSQLRSIYSYISLYVSRGKTCATQDDMSLTFKHLFFFFSWQKHVLFSLSGHFCAKKGKMDVLEECPWKVWTTQVARWSRRCNQLNNRTTKEQPRLR